MKKILIVDKIQQNLKLMKNYFTDSGYEVTTADTLFA